MITRKNCKFNLSCLHFDIGLLKFSWYFFGFKFIQKKCESEYYSLYDDFDSSCFEWII